MMTATSQDVLAQPARPAWRLDWLTPVRCWIILAVVLLLGFFGHVRYLNDNCPIDLSGDEAQYWDWSRNLDLSYYSKGPLVAYIIRASCAMFGETMQAVRYPALVLGVATSMVTFLLTRKLFGSDRLALGAVLLNHFVPMFVAGSVLMTIDPPYFFCWAMCTYFAAIALFEGKSWPWVFVGVFAGIGFLAKYAILLWFVGLVVFMLADPLSRKRLRSPGPWVAFAISLLFTAPVIIWNARHGWASVKHVAHQTGASGGALSRGNFLEFIGSQIGVVGPLLAVIIVAAVIFASRSQREAIDTPKRRAMFLVCIGLTFFAFNLIISFVTKVQVNWPAPAYFTLMILSAWFIGTRMQNVDTWKRWRGWVWGAIIFGLVLTPIVHDTSIVFPLVRKFNSVFGTKIQAGNIDLSTRLRGWQQLGSEVTLELRALGDRPFVLCDDYMQTAEMAFYVEGQPVTYYAGSYYADAKRFTQYDMWPNRRLDQPELLGRNAIYVGKGGEIPAEIPAAFERISERIEIPVIAGGETVKTSKIWRCYGFKGMKRAAGAGDY
jgi:undecaprenyl-diphosphatase